MMVKFNSQTWQMTGELINWCFFPVQKKKKKKSVSTREATFTEQNIETYFFSGETLSTLLPFFEGINATL